MKVKTKVLLKRIAMGQAISQFGWELLTKWHFIMFYQKYINYLHFTRIKNKTMKKAKITSIFKKGSRRLTKCLMINFFLSLIRTTPTSRMTNPTCNTKEIQSIRYIFIANHSNDKKYIKILHYVKGEIYVYMLHIHCLKSVFGSIFQKRRRKVIASTRDSLWIEVKVKKINV